MIICVVVTSKSFGQDVHFSQFLYSPLNLNPAMTGNFDGRYRVAFNYRNQWRSVSKAFQTTSISGDARDFMNVRNLGLGASFYWDVAGTSGYRTLKFEIPLSYRINLTKDSVHSIIPGIAPSFNQQSIDPSALTFDDQFNGNRYNPNSQSAESIGNDRFSQNYVDFAAGAAYNYQSKKGFDITAGVAVHNITEGQGPWLLGGNSLLGQRTTFHAGAHVPLGKSWFLTPGIIHMRQADYRETSYGTEINLLTQNNPYRYRAFFVGLWNRGSDAAIGDIGMYYNSWRVGLSYDVNYSRLNVASNYRGGWEISVIYILRELLPKRRNFKYCPNYI